ncbi:MAG: DUF2726 domain-containing protein [Phycisphaeraceae bacterium]
MAQQPPAGCLWAILRIFRGGAARGASEQLPYRRRDYLLSRAERSFFGVLGQALGAQYLIFAKVRLADLLWMPRGTQQRQAHFNRIQSKHVDFLLCDRASVRPLLVIELDDASHDEPDRRERDNFLDAALQAAGLPVIHVPAQATYNTNHVRQNITEKLAELVEKRVSVETKVSGWNGTS